jgi:Lipopolysaccharide biosynthesis proteins, LPS:glycosyltransferases
MNIEYTCDDNFVWLAGISMISLFEMNKNLKEINVYLLGDNISDKNKGILREISSKYSRTFVAIDVPELDIPEILCNQRWPRSVYIRLFSGQLLPKDIKSILYLDCDTIITNDLSQLENLNIEDKIVYGVKDCIGRLYKENIGLSEDTVYINAGILMFNVEKLRDMDMSKEISGFLNKYAKTMFFADQDVLNGIFKGDVGVLNPKYDLMTLLYSYSYKEIQSLRKPTAYYSKVEIEEAKEKPCIVHFTTCMLNVRPWFHGSNHPYSRLFDMYWTMSPWSKMPYQVKKKDSKEDTILKFLLSIMPKKIGISILGILHSNVRPFLVRHKTRLL